jgi:hypothetical protein
VSHSLELDAPAHRSPADDGVRERLIAAWRDGDIQRVRAALAADARLTQAETNRVYTPADLETEGAPALLATTLPTQIDVGAGGRVQAAVLNAVPSESPGAEGPIPPLPKTLQPLLSPIVPGSGADLRTILGWSARVVTMIAVVIGTLAAAAPILDAVYSVWPNLRPQGPATALGMTVENVQLEERYVPCNDGDRCNLVSFELELIGYTGGKSIVEWATLDPVTLRRVPLTGDSTENQPGVEITTEAASDRLSGSLLIPIPLEGRCAIVRVYVYDDTGKTRVDYGDTPPFHTHLPEESCSSSSTREPAA